MGAFNIKLNATVVYQGSGIGWPLKKWVRYDSTHFPDETLVKIVTTMSNTEGKTFTDEDWYVVYNKYSVRQCDEFANDSPGSDLAASFAGTLGGMNHAAVGTGTGYSKSAFLADCERATAVHFSLHGWPTYLTHTNQNPTAADKVIASDISGAISTLSWRPPINVVFGAACLTCAPSATIPGAFGIPASGAVNRAYVGFDRKGWILGLQKAGDAFWKVLKEGTSDNGMPVNPNARKVSDAKQAAQIVYNQVNKEIVDLGNETCPATCMIVGDGAATLFGLYQRPSYQAPQTAPWFVTY
jgi:hypothetical protein